jgi:hypothetical protein
LKVLHSDIGQVVPVHNEITIPVPAHYVIDIILALAYLLAMSAIGLSPHNLVAALGFGLCTNLLPWLLMFRAMGYGWFGAARSIGNTIIRQ